MRPIPAIVESATAQVEAAVRDAASALREAEAQLAKAEKRVESARGATAMRRLELGKALVAARAEWPERGPNARGWGQFLEREGISQSTAWRLMRDAGYQGEEDYEFSFTEGLVNENNPVITDESPPQPPAWGWGGSDPEGAPEPEPERKPVSALTRVGFDLRLGAWTEVLADIGMVDSVISDAPFSARVHSSRTTRADGYDPSGLGPGYAPWTVDDIEAFVAAWSPRCRGWMVALCDDGLIDPWRARYAHHGRFDFSPVPCVIQGMSHRMRGDGPSSWAVYAMVARPRSADFAAWGSLPGAYIGARGPGAGGGRGKPLWLTDQIVRDYSRSGDLVCDPLAGYGGTLVSALDAGRRAIGAELDQDAHQEAHRRAAAPRGTTQDPGLDEHGEEEA